MRNNTPATMADAGTGWTSLIDSMRKLGDFPILINSGWDSDDLEWIAPKINGIMYEDSVAHTNDKNPEKFYARIQTDWERLRQPRIGLYRDAEILIVAALLFGGP